MSSHPYQKLKAELEEVLTKLESEETDVDEAILLYEKGQKLAAQLEAYLKKTEAKIKKLKI